MKKIKQYIVNTFTDKLFSGNPAAICLIEKWLPDELMMKIAMENKLSETAFVVRENEQYKLRWFTPKMEIDLCGHATLAATYVITSFVEPNKTTISFQSVLYRLACFPIEIDRYATLNCKSNRRISYRGISWARFGMCATV